MAAIEDGVELDRADKYGWTALHEAMFCHSGIAELLLNEGANPNVRTISGDTPLHWAAKYGKEDLVMILLEHGADPKIRNNDGVTPADLAQGAGHRELVRILTTANAATRILPRDSGKAENPFLTWGTSIDDFLLVEPDRRYYRQSGDLDGLDAVYLVTGFNYLGFESLIYYGFLLEKGLVVTSIMVDETAGDVYDAAHQHLKSLYEPGRILENGQIWVGQSEIVFVTVGSVEGTRIIYVDQEYAIENFDKSEYLAESPGDSS